VVRASSIHAAVEAWTGAALIVSHDRALLSLVDQVADLSGGALRMYGGNLEAYETMLATEQAAALRTVAVAAADVRRERRDLIETQVKQARRDRQGRAVAASGSIPRIVAGGRKRAAQVSAGKGREIALARTAGAEERLAEAEKAVRDDSSIRVSLLDEPTNNLDMASVRQLSEALSCYRGALVVVSHDVPFLRSIGITRWLLLDRSGRVADTGPPSPPGEPGTIAPSTTVAR